jgi:predicted type IV restriction endonuclease
MDLIDQLKSIADQVGKIKDQIQTEQATKSAFIMPFIQALGYNVFNPLEVCPEYTADAPGIKAEKVDYAILKNNAPVLLFECKSCHDKLGSPKHGSQLFRYFASTSVRFGILTNGIQYRFYTDLEKQNTMDTKPFFEFSILEINDSIVSELKKFSKVSFEPESMKIAASEMMYTREIKRILQEQLTSPSPDFIKYFAGQVYSGIKTQSVLEMFAELVRRSFSEFISERLTDRLKSALDVETLEVNSASLQMNVPSAEPASLDDGIVTTAEELEAFYLVKSLLRDTVEPSRIQYKDTKSYFAVLLDGNVRRTICRFAFNTKQKYLVLVESDKSTRNMPISTLDDIFGHASELKARVAFLDKSPTVPQTMPSQIE